MTFVGHVCSLLGTKFALCTLKFNVTAPNKHTLLCAAFCAERLHPEPSPITSAQVITLSSAKARSVPEQTAAKLFHCESKINHQKL